MKGSPKVIEELNKALREELTAINQYFLHAEMCENWGYEKFSDYIKKQSIGEMKHAEVLIERILFLDGISINEATRAERWQERERHSAERSGARDSRREAIQRGNASGASRKRQWLTRSTCAAAERRGRPRGLARSANAP